MGLRFRKSIKIAPGIKLNLGKKSIGMSTGDKYGGISMNSKTGIHGRVSAPGTGISYTAKLGDNGKKNGAMTNNYYTSSGNNNKKDPNKKWYTKTRWIIFFLIIFPPIGIFLMWNYKKDSWSKNRKIVLTAIFSIYFIIAVTVGGGNQKNNSIAETTEQATISDSTISTSSETEELTAEEPTTEKTVTEEQTTEDPTTENQTTIEETTPVIPSTPTQTTEYIEQVWINDSGEKYHKKSDCSGMNGAYQVPKDQAINMGKAACKKCY